MSTLANPTGRDVFSSQGSELRAAATKPGRDGLQSHTRWKGRCSRSSPVSLVEQQGGDALGLPDIIVSDASVTWWSLLLGEALSAEELAGSLAAAGVDLKSVDPKEFVPPHPGMLTCPFPARMCC